MILNNVIEATFLERQNRFVWLWKIDNQLVKFHIWDTGALPNLLFAWNKILLQNLSWWKRKYNFRLIASKWILWNYILTNSLLHSALVREYLDKQNILYKPEVFVWNSRIDFLLEGETYVEIKWCTLFKKVNNEIFWMFPDAPTTRWQKHLQELIQLRKQGINTQIWFLLSEKIDKFMPNFEIDKNFSLLFNDFLFTWWKVNFLYANLRFYGRNLELSLGKLTNVEILAFKNL